MPLLLSQKNELLNIVKTKPELLYKEFVLIDENFPTFNTHNYS